MVSAFLQIDRNSEPDPDTGSECRVTIRGGANPWWAGLDVATDADAVILDFSTTGLDLSNNVRVDAGNFSASASVSGQTMSLSKPLWVTLEQPGYLGFNANNNTALANFKTPTCRAQ